MKPLHGNTFSIKDQIKAAGGKWNPLEKVWHVPEDQFDKLQALMPKKILSGQLWEPCEQCGNEPVYMSLDCLCERCG